MSDKPSSPELAGPGSPSTDVHEIRDQQKRTSELVVTGAPSPGVHEIRHEQKRYLAVYAVLVVGTVLTVAMYYVHFEELWQTVGVALLIAATKAAFVAAIFMHLWHGQRDIYKILFFTGVFVAGMFVLTTYAHFSLPGLGHYVR